MTLGGVKSARNKTLQLSDAEKERLSRKLVTPEENLTEEKVSNTVFHDDIFRILPLLPKKSVDLMILDPPYNLDKDFHGLRFVQTSDSEYYAYIEQCFAGLVPLLKPEATVYICGDWRCAATLYTVAERYLTVRNRIAWQREKGRGALTNWKNCTEDIWFATLKGTYYFDPEAVKVRRKVIAPYKKEDGKPKDWVITGEGKFRMTYASNFWDDITVPYWSMPENTEHPTQKPEKLIAKLILASCPEGGLVFDPFLGSGTTAVVASKLNRRYCGVEINEEYCRWALKRLEMARRDKRIQGYHNGIFWERNSTPKKRKTKKVMTKTPPVLERDGSGI